MDDKEFRELMNEYVRSTPKGKDSDLAKLNVAPKPSRKKFNLRWAAAVCSVVIIVAVSLAVALPLTLDRGIPEQGDTTGQGGDNQQVYYCKSKNTVQIDVGSYETLQTEYGIEIIQPTVDALVSKVFALYSQEYEVAIGASVELSIFDINFDILNITATKENYVYDKLKPFDSCQDKTVWQNHSVFYSINDSNGDGYYEHYIKFEADGYNYFVEFSSFKQIEAAAALDLIFG